MDSRSSQDRPPPWDTTDWVLATAACTASALAVVGAAFLAFGPEHKRAAPPAPRKEQAPQGCAAAGQTSADEAAGEAGAGTADPSEAKKSKGVAAVPAKPTAADLFDATEALADESSTPAEKWRAAAVIAILASHAALRQHVGRPEQAGAVRGLIAMVVSESSTATDRSAASEALSMLFAEPAVRKMAATPQVARAVLKHLSWVVARALAPPDDPASSPDADMSRTAGSARKAVRWHNAPCSVESGEDPSDTGPTAGQPRKLPLLSPVAASVLGAGLLSDHDGLAALLLPKGVASLDTATLAASSAAAMSDAASGDATGGQAVLCDSDDPAAPVSLLDALSVMRACTMLVNMAASPEGVRAIVAGAVAGEEEGCIAVMPLLATATAASTTQLSALRLVQNLASGLWQGEMDSAHERDEAPASEAVDAPGTAQGGTGAAATSGSALAAGEVAADPKQPTEAAAAAGSAGASATAVGTVEQVGGIFLPLVWCVGSRPGFMGVIEPDHILRVVVIISKLMQGVIGTAGPAGRGAASPLASSVGAKALDGGAVAALSSALVEATDRIQLFKQALASAGIGAKLTPVGQHQAAAAAEASQLATRVLNTIVGTFPDRRGEVEAILGEMQRIARERRPLQEPADGRAAEEQ